MKILYTGEATAIGGRRGRVSSSDGLLSVELATPEEMGGAGGATNPEQLFAAGYAACFASALAVVARRQDLPISTGSVTVKVHLGIDTTGRYGLAAEVQVFLPDVPEVMARAVANTAHDSVCPYSRAICGNVPVTLKVAGKQVILQGALHVDGGSHDSTAPPADDPIEERG